MKIKPIIGIMPVLMAGIETRHSDSRGMVPHPEPEKTGIITAETFRLDNQSELAKAKIDLWYKNYNQGKSYLRLGCSDARPVFDEELVWSQRSVSCGFPHKDIYADAYTGSKVIATVVDTHYGKFENGKRPEGCGGQDTSAKIKSGVIEVTEGITGYVSENVHEDPIVQGILQAKEVVTHLKNSGKEGRVFVTTQDHRSGLIVPVAEYVVANGKLVSSITALGFGTFFDAETEEEIERAYMPSILYATGIPSLTENSVSGEFKKYLEIAKNKVDRVKAEHSDFSETQAVQNPWALVISANKIPVQNRYPTLFGNLGSAFQVDIPRTKNEREGVVIPPEAIETAICQMQYAMEHAVEHHGIPNTDFSDSKTLFIETGSLSQSRRVAHQLFAKDENGLFVKDWAGAWLALGGKVFLAETHAGTTSRTEEYVPIAA